MFLADAGIRPIAFVPLDQKHKCELLDSYPVNLGAEQMVNDTSLKLSRSENIFNADRTHKSKNIFDL